MAVSVIMHAPDDLEEWKDHARTLLTQNVPPDQVWWRMQEDGDDLFSQAPEFGSASSLATFTVPKAFPPLAGSVILHRDTRRFDLLYRLVVQLQAEPSIIYDDASPLMRELHLMAKSVRRDIHKMRAFVRFREIDGRYVAWFEPEHHITRANAGFFQRRFASMHWSILTPQASIHWDGQSLREGPGASRSDAPDGDPVEDVWRSYYSATFNPSRLKLKAMLKEMPKRYWNNMPETALIPELISGARARELQMIENTPSAPHCPSSLNELARELKGCRRCPLWKPATQVIPGEGAQSAKIMLVGEQPGDEEDKAGTPFVGPAGQVLNRAMEEAGLDRGETFITNAVKHFKYEMRGKRRIHSKPNAGEIDACRWWIKQELALVKPQAIIMLGATAARSVLGKAVTIGKVREESFDVNGGIGSVTVHPSYLLRLPDEQARAQEYKRFVEDLRRAAAHVG